MTCIDHKRHQPKQVALRITVMAVMTIMFAVAHARSCPESRGDRARTP